MTHNMKVIIWRIKKEYCETRMGWEDDMEHFWDLVDAGYLNTPTITDGEMDFLFTLTIKGKEYFKPR